MATATVQVSAGTSRLLSVRLASQADRQRIYRLRHDVYAQELGQHSCNREGVLTDALDEFNEYIVVADGDALLGFISITPPGGGRYSLDKYLARDEWPFPADDGLYELRLLTVVQTWRAGPIAMLLMHASQRYLQEHGATRVIAIGRREVIDLYLKIGLKRLGPSFASGAVRYDLLSAELEDIVRCVACFESSLERLRTKTRWEMECTFFHEPANNASAANPPTCFHGGAFFDEIGVGFEDLRRRHEIINADVLDAWFPPAPAVVDVLREHLDWVLRTSPPTQCDGLIEEISRARGVPRECLVPGAGSSDLVFRALLRWVEPGAHVLILDPMYGEYRHIFENVIGCQVERLMLRADAGFELDLDELSDQLKREYDLVVLVNPNNPTGGHVPRAQLEPILRDAPATTRFWIDEAYLDYVSPDESLEPFAVTTDNVVICKSMSKVYALSGVRCGYLCGPRVLMEGLRSTAPPWAVSLPAQIAGVLALRDPDYYSGRYAETRRLRADLSAALEQLGLQVWSSEANFLLCRLPNHSGDAAGLIARCRRRGLFLRDVSSMTARPDSAMFRVAVKDAAMNAAIIEIVRQELATALVR
ncbi:MAG: histidinol-phosphate transaminase [Planctomycetaceae bacterium]